MSLEYVRHQKAKNYIQACTNGPLTYVRTLKNASSFFYNSFTGSFRWWPIDWLQIQWHETHVFSHIQDPIERRHKGVLEYVIMNDCQDLLCKDKNFQRFVRHIPCTDEHNVSLFEMYGSWCHSIDWIPIYLDTMQTVAITEKLLKSYGQRLFPWDHDSARPASEDMKKMLAIVKDLWQRSDEHHLPGHTRAYLSRDIDLYDKVLSRFNPNGDTWQRSSWLRQD
jgi:hypothetical protein